MTAPPRRVLGVIGHVDHGKTALVRALTGVETDRLPEERRRGLSIALGFALARLGALEADVIDMPGHERFVRTMVGGASGVDAVLVVVAATEGVRPQTVEHVEVASLLGVRRAVVALTKADLADAAQLAAAARGAADLLARHGVEARSPVPVSSLTGAGVELLRQNLEALLTETPTRGDDGFAWMPLDRAFTLAGLGTVVTGALRRGPIAVGDPLELTPSGAPVRVRGLQRQGAAVVAAPPGGRLAVNLRDVEPAAAGRGAALASPGLLAASRWWSVELTAAATSPELADGARVVVMHGTGETEARTRLLDRSVLAPGETAPAQLHFSRPVVSPARERFVLRSASPARTLGGGRVLDPEATRLRRGDPADLSAMAALAGAPDAGALVREVLAREAAAGVSTLRLARLAGVGAARARSLAEPSAFALRGEVWVDRAAWRDAAARLSRLLEREEVAQPRGTPVRRLRSLAPDVGAPVLEALLARMAATGLVALEGGLVRPLHAAREAARVRTGRDLAAKLADSLRRGGLAPPDPEGPPREVKGAVERLVREGVLVRTYDRVQKREVIFHRDAVDEARRLLRPLLVGEGLRVSEAGAALGVSRKYSVPLLEHLDAVQFTRRDGDRRVLGRGASA